MNPFLRGLLWPWCVLGIHRWRVRCWWMDLDGEAVAKDRCKVCERDRFRTVNPRDMRRTPSLWPGDNR